MTERQEQREKAYREFTWFGASRFALYLTGGIALILGSTKIAGWLIVYGAAIGLGRTLAKLTKLI